MEGETANSAAYTASSAKDHQTEIETTGAEEEAKVQWMTYRIGETVFNVPSQYKLKRVLGQGAFGVVVSAEMEDGRMVAIKKVSINEHNVIEVKRLVREVALLAHFQHENLIPLVDILPPPPKGGFKSLYMVIGLMDTDLHDGIATLGLTEEYNKYFLYQILCGLKAIHSAGVLHRDLKPHNILINENCDLKICDFGLAKEEGDDMTTYVATRWYRAPELIMQWRNYSTSVDIWSVGCIFAELYLKKPLFQGKDYLGQFNLILGVLGKPTPEEIDGIGSDQARNFLAKMEAREAVDLHTVVPTLSDAGVDLLSMMLQFDPRNRPSAEACLEHQYFESCRTKEDEITCPRFDLGMDLNASDLTVFDLKKVLWEQMANFHPEHKGRKWWSDREEREAESERQGMSSGV